MLPPTFGTIEQGATPAFHGYDGTITIPHGRHLMHEFAHARFFLLPRVEKHQLKSIILDDPYLMKILISECIPHCRKELKNGSVNSWNPIDEVIAGVLATVEAKKIEECNPEFYAAIKHMGFYEPLETHIAQVNAGYKIPYVTFWNVPLLNQVYAETYGFDYQGKKKGDQLELL